MFVRVYSRYILTVIDLVLTRLLVCVVFQALDDDEGDKIWIEENGVAEDEPHIALLLDEYVDDTTLQLHIYLEELSNLDQL